MPLFLVFFLAFVILLYWRLIINDHLKLCAVLCLVAQAASDSLRPPWAATCHTPLSMGILQAILEWAASSRDLPNSGIKPRSPALQVDSLPCDPPGKPKTLDKTKSVSKQNQSPCWVSHREVFSPLSFWTQVPPHSPTVNGQIVNRSDVLNGEPSPSQLPPLSPGAQVSPCRVLNGQLALNLWEERTACPPVLERRVVSQGKVFTDKKGQEKNLSAQGEHCSVGRNTHSN